MYASNAGKSGGEFFTLVDVSELLTRLGTVGKTEINKVYDPAAISTCSSTMRVLINFDIACEDTLTAPQHWDDEPFELIVSNPPYSIKWAGDDDLILNNAPAFLPLGCWRRNPRSTSLLSCTHFLG